MDKQDVVFLHFENFEKLFSLKKENSITCYNIVSIDPEDIMLSETNRYKINHKKTNTVRFPQEVFKVVKFIETESRMMVTRAQGREKRGTIVQWGQSLRFTR